MKKVPIKCQCLHCGVPISDEVFFEMLEKRMEADGSIKEHNDRQEAYAQEVIDAGFDNTHDYEAELNGKFVLIVFCLIVFLIVIISLTI